MIVLTAVDQAVLIARSRAGRSEYRDVVRARIVLAAAAGQTNESSAAALAVCVDTVRKWRNRSPPVACPAWRTYPGHGRPRRFTPVQVAQVKALACTLPAETGLPLSRWSGGQPPPHRGARF